MYSLNEYVVYGHGDICRITEIKVPDFIKTGEEYYFLNSLINKGSLIYVNIVKPQKNIRPLILQDYALEMINSIQDLEGIYDPNDKIRDKEYLGIIYSGDFLDWLKCFKGLCEEKKRRIESGLKLNMLDEKNYKKFSAMIITELVLALDKSQAIIINMLKSQGLSVL